MDKREWFGSKLWMQLWCVVLFMIVGIYFLIHYAPYKKNVKAKIAKKGGNALMMAANLIMGNPSDE